MSLWDAATGVLVRNFEGHSDAVFSVAFSADGTRLLSGSWDGTLKLWVIATGQMIRTFWGHSNRVISVAFSPDGTRIVSAGMDTTIRIWDAATGSQIATLIGGRGGEWLSITPAGFFATSGKGTDMLGVTRGLESYSVMQFYEHLYQPELVEELLKGDPEEKYSRAARELSLTKILDSGPAPSLELLQKETEVLASAVRVRVRIKDEGGGIGKRVVWRINGQARGETKAPELLPGGENAVVVEQILKVVPGQVHSVQVVAYNGASLLASLPLSFPVSVEGAASTETRMHVLAIGVTDYAKEDWHLNDRDTWRPQAHRCPAGVWGTGQVVRRR